MVPVVPTFLSALNIILKSSRFFFSFLIINKHNVDAFPLLGCYVPRFVVAYRSFWSTYQSRPEESSSPRRMHDNLIWDRYVVPKLRSTILVNNQLDALFQCIYYFTSLHVSSNPVLIIRRIKCFNTSSGMFPPDRHTRQSPTHSDTYQMMY
jgi:hypothetical protein